MESVRRERELYPSSETVRGSLDWISRKAGPWKNLPRVVDHSTKPDRVEEASRQCSQAHDVILGVFCALAGHNDPYGSLQTQDVL